MQLPSKRRDETHFHLSFMQLVPHAFMSAKIRCKTESVLPWMSLPIADVCTVLQRRACGPCHKERCIYVLDSWLVKSATFESQTNHKTITNLPLVDNTDINMVSGFVMQIFFSANKTTLHFAAMLKLWETPPRPVSLPPLMHTDKPRPLNKCWLNHELMATNVDSHRNSELSDIVMVFIYMSTTKRRQKYLKVWLWDDHSRTSEL